MNTMLLGMALTIGAPALKTPTEPSILGNWVVSDWLADNSKVAFNDGVGVEFQPDGKRIWRDGPGEADQRGYKLYPKTNPAAIDLTREVPQQPPWVYPSIFKIEGDTLVIAIASPGSERPKTFEAKDTYMLMTFKRVKKKD